MPFAFRFHGQRSKDRLASDKAEDSRDQDAEQRSAAVYENVSSGGSPAGNKGLMIFIQKGKAHAEQTCHKYQGNASEPVDIERQRHRYGQQKIFRKMCQLADIGMQTVCVAFDLYPAQIHICSLVHHLNGSFGDFIAELSTALPVLRRQTEDDIHHYEGRYKGKGFEQQTQQSFDKDSDIM